ncbi:Polysialic acid transport protein KpsD [Ferriphaselus amnicola]|uniref:Polysialic acid transport protein KpsD n=1 Tax=Ferriphaselus amnicola TaxID=1188319 RepID=A0A2Z6GA75_9PROT|nr:SLBB domain-containing protein [Ferriphaselus amnicola]BBE50249.1 Polysialic acid transport protein KpsD [Ferriphaselus amnicola]
MTNKLIKMSAAVLMALAIGTGAFAQDSAGLAAMLGQKGQAGMFAKMGQQQTTSTGNSDEPMPQPTILPPQPEENSAIEKSFNHRLMTSGMRTSVGQLSGAVWGSGVGQGSMNQGSMNQGSMNQGSMNQGSMNQGSMNQGSMNQGSMNQGSMNQGSMNQGSMNQGGFNPENNGLWSGGESADRLKQYGYQLFLNPAATLSPMTDVPIPPEYVLGPGDELRVQYYGSRNDSLSLTVDRNGMVNVPDLGEIGLTGISYNSARATLAEQISKKLTGVTASITMGHLRSMRVFVLGDVRNPGAYQVSSLATLSYALFASGGPSKRGSLRHVQLKRGGKKVGEIDMYDFLLKGDGHNDRQLLPGDVVFVPPIGDVVAVAGEVTRPGIYELSRERGLRELLELAGRPLHTADKARFEIDRLENGGSRQKINLDMGLNGKAVPIQAGDLVLLHANAEDPGPYVDLTGAVKRPGRYGFKPGMMLRDLIASKDSLLPESYLKRVEVTHHTVVDGEIRETSRDEHDLEKLLMGVAEADVSLRVYDEVLVRTIANWGESQKVTLSGEVRFPGVYTVAKGDRLSSLIARAGGLSSDAYLPAMVLTRESVRKQQAEDNKRLAGQIRRQLNQLGADLAKLNDADLIKAKKETIDQTSRFLAELESSEPVGRLLIEFPEGMTQIAGGADVVLHDGDKIQIPETPAEVIVMGQVYNPAALSFDTKLKRDDYIEMAGGVTEAAKEDTIFLVRASGVVVAGKKVKGAPIKPGDAIVVPQDINRVNVLDGAIAWSKVLMQSGVSIATLRIMGVL